MTPLSMKIDQLYELAGLARMDGDKADEKRYLDRIAELRKKGI